jgi:hypothetical protein
MLGLVALIGGRPEDTPAIMYALARGAEAGLSQGDRRSPWPLNQFRQEVRFESEPLPAGQRAYYNDGLLPESLI